MRVILIPGWMNSLRRDSAEPVHRERSRPWEDRAAIIRKRTGLPTEVEWFRSTGEFFLSKKRAVSFADELAERLRSEEKGVFLIGHSLGGLVALRVAEQLPRLAGVVALSPAVEDTMVDWETLAERSYRTEVVYSTADRALQLFAVATGDAAAGSGLSRGSSGSLRWVDASDLTSGLARHDYLSHFEQILSRTLLWKALHRVAPTRSTLLIRSLTFRLGEEPSVTAELAIRSRGQTFEGTLRCVNERTGHRSAQRCRVRRDQRGKYTVTVTGSLAGSGPDLRHTVLKYGLEDQTLVWEQLGGPMLELVAFDARTE